MSQLESTLSLVRRTDTQAWLLILTVLSVALALVFAPEDWSMARKVLAGVLTGVGSTMCVFMPRMIGGSDFN